MADDDDDDKGGGDGGQGGTGGGDGGGGGFNAEQLATIRQVIRETLEGLGDGDAGGDKGGDGGGADGGPGGPPTGGRLIDQELHFEQLVRRELERVKSSEKVGSLEEQVRKIMERPPKRYRKITESMWGRGGDD